MSYVGDGLPDRVRVKATADFAANATLSINGDLASSGNGPYAAPKAVKAGESFFAEFTGAGSSGASVANGATVAVVNSAGSDSHSATATVTGSTLTNVKFAGTVAMVDSGDTLTGVAPSGTYTDTVTFTVANGVITAIALS